MDTDGYVDGYGGISTILTLSPPPNTPTYTYNYTYITYIHTYT